MLLVRVDVIPVQAVPPARRDERGAAVALDGLAEGIEAMLCEWVSGACEDSGWGVVPMW